MSGQRRRTRVRVGIRYAAFAVIATVVNITTQVFLVALIQGESELYLAMAGGTVTGLLCKFALDRRWIFGDRTPTFRRNATRFAAYTSTGLLTTCLFWAVELGFAQLGSSNWLPYLGASLGLAVGYTTKYFLDKRFVFVT